MLVPATVPGVTDPGAAHLLQPRWNRARRYLMTALAGCPWAIAVLCACVLVVAGATSGFAWWSVVAVIGSVLPAAVALGSIRAMVYEPPKWIRVAVLSGGCQLLLGVFPAVGIAVSAGGAAASVGTAAFVLSLAAVALGVFAATRAMRALLTPVSLELGATPFTIAVRARLHDTGLVSGSVSITQDSVVLAARRHRATGRGVVHFRDVRDAQPTTLSGTRPSPWLTLWDGSAVQAMPGPAVSLSTSSGNVMLPVDDPQLFLGLLSARIGTWRGARPR